MVGSDDTDADDHDDAPPPTDRRNARVQGRDPMSFWAVAWALDSATMRDGSKLGPSEVLVLVCIGEQAGETNEAWPSIAFLARRAHLSTDQTRRIIRKLEGEGLIQTVTNGTPDRRIPRDRASNLYRLNIPPHGPASTRGRGPTDPAPTPGRDPAPARQRPRVDASQTISEPPTEPPASAEGQALVAQAERLKAIAQEANQTARDILAPWWESFDPRPTMNYMGAVQIIARFVKAGWSREEIARALGQQTPPFTSGRLEVALRRNRPRQGRTDVASSTSPTAYAR